MGNRILVIGTGAAGNKMVNNAIKSGAINAEDALLVNSTSKDFPEDYTGKKIVLSSTNTGCGKERQLAKLYTSNAIKNGLFDLNNFGTKYTTVYIVSSVEGGTGSGSATMLAQYFNQVHVLNAHVWAITSFGEDVRGLSNTIEFFKEIKDNIIVHTISNAAFLSEADGNKEKAEILANEEFVRRYNVVSGNLLIPGSQNIDDTDIIKLSNTYGYTIAEYKELDKSLGDSSDYDKIIKRMIYESKSIKSTDPCATRIGVILNLKKESRDVLKDEFAVLRENYGTTFENYKHVQWDEQKEYIAYIVGGMKMPIDEITKIYDSYVALSNKINKADDKFFSAIKDMGMLDEDKKFDMLQPTKKAISTEEFLSNF